MAQRKLALLIGINRYKYSSTAKYPGAVFADLAGAEDDIADMQSLLQQNFGFRRGDIVALVNQDATRAGIVKAIQTHLAARALADDIVVIHFSGHGSYRGGTKEEPCESTLVPHDSRGPDVGDITGRELGELLRTIAAKNITFILDSCHSGGFSLARGRGRVRSIPPEDDSHLPTSRNGGGVAARSIANIHHPRSSFALLAAARAVEPAHEMEFSNVWRGIFTYYFAQRVRDAGPGATYRDILESVRGLVNIWFPGQNPNLEGAQQNHFVFGDASCEPAPYVLVSPLAQNRVQIEAGRVHGVTAGSCYSIFAPGPEGKQEPITEAVVKQVNSTTAIATLREGKAVPLAARAVEKEHRHEGIQTRIAVSNAPFLAHTLKDYSHLEIFDDPAQNGRCDIRVVADPNGIQILIENLPGKSFRIPAKANGAGPDLHRAEQAVLSWAKWLNLLRTNNPHSELHLQFICKPLAKEPGGEEDSVYYDDGGIAYQICNCSGPNLYISMLAFGDDGSVRVVYPLYRSSKLLAHGQMLKGDLCLDEIESSTTELNFLKVVATVEPVDLRILEMPALHARERGNMNPLEKLLTEAAFGPRYIRTPPISSDWVTLERTVLVQKRAP